MKKSASIIILLVAIILAFMAGYLSRQPILTKDINEIIGTDEAIERVEFFEYNWGEDQGDYGQIKDSIGGVERECYLQAERQLITTGIRENLIECSANDIMIQEGILKIQCACLF